MKKNEIHAVVADHFNHLDKLLPAVLSRFDENDILNFRKEVKRLKSFLHLLEMEAVLNQPLLLPHRLKSFYGYVGIIRNLQLQFIKLSPYFKNPGTTSEFSYLKKIKEDIVYWKNNARQMMGSNPDLYREKISLLENLPGKLRSGTTKKFIRYISYEIQLLLGRSRDDEALHNIRKFLQDGYNNFHYIKEYASEMPAGLDEREEMNSFIEQLTLFQDKCIAVTMLETWYNDSADKEKLPLENILQEWKIQKQQLKDGINYRLQQIPVKPLVKRFANLSLN
jgi:hypothetical protein